MNKENILIIGAGEAGRELYSEIKKHFYDRYKVVGFLDDNKKLVGTEIVGELKVLGTISKLSHYIEMYKISEVFIAVPSARGSLIRNVVKRCEKQKVVFKIVPRLLEIVEGKVRLSKVREIKVEDLLGRAIVKSDQKILKNEFLNKTVLITGAAGSIGSEICRQILSFKPKKIIALDFWESGLYDLALELSDISNKNSFECVIANIQDKERISSVIFKEKPDIIFHTAAYKHVPLMQKFPIEAVKNNIFGTHNLVKVAIVAGVKKFINISTDKAVDPSSIMGTTKLITEMMVTLHNKLKKTKFCSVRFGNVLGSQGSVVPTFKKQIAKGGPVTVTSKNMTRFFMTIPEAVQLVLNASLYVRGGEVYMLDMGEPVVIDELARLMIRLAGFIPNVDIPIKYSGVRRGEKFSEKLIKSNENTQKTSNEKIYLVKGKRNKLDVDKILIDLKLGINHNSESEIFDVLLRVAPNLQKVG